MEINKPTSQSRQFDGSETPFTKYQKIKAGDLDLLYFKGTIRQIKLGHHEYIRSIYFALRDEHWNTIPFQIENEIATINEDNFQITFNAIHDQDDFKFTWMVEIRGHIDNTILYSIKGQSNSTFLRNRMGLCILHPVKECHGEPCEITDSKGKTIKKQFSETITPDTLFTDITAFKWSIDSHQAQLLFRGEKFESEDQRNWSDASYKTYGTLLKYPMPVKINPGDSIEQEVEFKLTPDQKVKNDTSEVISIHPGKKIDQIPKIGIHRSDEKEMLGHDEINWLKALELDYYQVSLDLKSSHWQNNLDHALNETSELDWDLHLTLIIGKNYEKEIEEFIQHTLNSPEKITSILIVTEEKDLHPDSFARKAEAMLKKQFPQTRLGTGTDGNLITLNEQRPKPKHWEFFNFGLNPQVHAFDNLTLIENVCSIPDMVTTVKSFGNQNTSVSISPVSFLPYDRRLIEMGKDNGRFASSDPRQFSLFGAGWTLALLHNCFRSEASEVTLFQTTGTKGIMLFDPSMNIPEDFHQYNNQLFPIYHLLFLLKTHLKMDYIDSTSSEPYKVNALVFQKENKKTYLLANHTNEEQKVYLSGTLNSNASIYYLDTNTANQFKETLINEQIEKKELASGNNPISIDLPPFVISVIQITPS